MDPNLPSSSPRKVKYAPKAPPRRKPRPTEPAVVSHDEDHDNDREADEQAAEALLRRANEHLMGRRPKVEKKSSVQVAFAHGAASSTCIRSFGKAKEGTLDVSDNAPLKNPSSSDKQKRLPLPNLGIDEDGESSPDDAENSNDKKKKEYREPWDYHHSYYPITLPLRRPYSGDPELLDEAEFADDATNYEYDENMINSASELGLLEKDAEPQMIFLQFPANLPLTKRIFVGDGRGATGHLKPSGTGSASATPNVRGVSGTPLPSRGAVSLTTARGKETVPAVSGVSGTSVGTKGKEITGSCSFSGRGNGWKKGCTLEELPAGYMGKMLVYKSGAVKLKLGDVLYDVSPGADCNFPQDVMAIDTIAKRCCNMGELGKWAVITPDIDSLLDPVIHLD